MEEDNGSGLTEFLNNPPEPVQEGAESTPSPETVKEELKPEVTEDKKPESDKPKETKEEVKAETEVKKEEKSSLDWETDDNVYKKKYSETEKRLKETRDWASLVNQKNVEFERQFAIINKKLDGTYNEEEERRSAASNVPPPDVIARHSEAMGRISASREAAYEMYGEKTVYDTLFAEGSVFRQIEDNPVVKARVLNSPSPILEAMKCVKEYHFRQKWGNDPDKIEGKIQESIKDKIREDIMKELREKMLLKEEMPQGISEARAISTNSSTKNDGYKPLTEIFGR